MKAWFVLAAAFASAPASAAIVFSQGGAIDAQGGFGSSEVQGLALAPGAYTMRIVFDQDVAAVNSTISYDEVSVVYEDDNVISANTVTLMPVFDALSPRTYTSPLTLRPGRILNPGPDRTEYFPDDFRGGSFEVQIDGDATIGYRFTIESFAAVPEPANWAAMICGFGLAGATLRRRSSLKAA
jgi:hypothetical protein